MLYENELMMYYQKCDDFLAEWKLRCHCNYAATFEANRRRLFINENVDVFDLRDDCEWL